MGVRESLECLICPRWACQRALLADREAWCRDQKGGQRIRVKECSDELLKEPGEMACQSVVISAW